MTERNKVYWHDAFFEAIKLELHQYQQFLDFTYQHPLSKEALKMDVLVVKKKPGIKIDKNIGRIFRTHNVIEFKSEKDYLSVNDYHKVMGYAYVYLSATSASVNDITISFSVTKHPREVLKYLKDERNLRVNDTGNGIYYVEGDVFPVQILESKLLPPDENLFLRNLRSNLTAEDAAKTLDAFREKATLEIRNAYIDRLLQANLLAFKEATTNMSEFVKYFFMEAARENSWLNELAVEQHAIDTAKRMLSRGYPIEEAAEIAALPLEKVRELNIAPVH